MSKFKPQRGRPPFSAPDEAVLAPPDRASISASLELLRALVRKELKVKYKRSVLGVLWSLITPLALMLVYFFVFVKVYRVPIPDFGFFLISGLLAWNYFNMAVLSGTNSIVGNAALVRRVYFSRMVLPFSSVGANLINFLIGLSVLCVVLVASGRNIFLQLHWLVVAVALQTVLCVGLTSILSIWNVYFRDIQQLISLLILVLFFATPVVYDLSQVPSPYRSILLANPLSSIMHIYRAALFYVRPPDLQLVILGTIESISILAAGVLIFLRASPNVAKEV